MSYQASTPVRKISAVDAPLPPPTPGARLVSVTEELLPPPPQMPPKVTQQVVSGGGYQQPQPQWRPQPQQQQQYCPPPQPQQQYCPPQQPQQQYCPPPQPQLQVCAPPPPQQFCPPPQPQLQVCQPQQMMCCPQPQQMMCCPQPVYCPAPAAAPCCAPGPRATIFAGTNVFQGCISNCMPLCNPPCEEVMIPCPQIIEVVSCARNPRCGCGPCCSAPTAPVVGSITAIPRIAMDPCTCCPVPAGFDYQTRILPFDPCSGGGYRQYL